MVKNNRYSIFYYFFEFVIPIKSRVVYWGKIIKNKISQSRNPLHKDNKISIKPECDVHHRQSTKRLQRQKSHAYIAKQM